MNRLLILLCLCVLGGGAAFGDEGQGPYRRILFLGDSITRHAPSEKLQWEGDRGMASSAPDKDYVHLFLAWLAQRQPGIAPDVWVAAEGGGQIADKLKFADRITAFHAALAIVQLGENDNADVTEAGFQAPYERLLDAVRQGDPQARILCTGVWGYPGGSPAKDAMIRAACRKYGATFVDLRMANADLANSASAEKRYENPGVAWHPGDRGMAFYAAALGDALSGKADEAASSTPLSFSLPLIEETWAVPLRLPWKPAPVLDGTGPTSVAKITQADATKTSSCAAELDPAAVKGRFLKVVTRVKGDAISDKPHPWNGVKLMLVIRNAEGKDDYPQYPLPVGTFDWTPVEWLIRVPDNAVQVRLVLGLENVSGTAWFDALRISETASP